MIKHGIEGPWAKVLNAMQGKGTSTGAQAMSDALQQGAAAPPARSSRKM